MIRRALILAAGKGQRLNGAPGPNCLTPVGGIPLLARTLRVLRRAGIREIAMTIGWQSAELRRRLDNGSIDPALTSGLVLFENEQWEKPNGLSVQVARSFITEPTLLVMSDQIAAPALIEELASRPSAGDRTVLCIDRDLARVFDVDDATKVKLSGEAVVAIGKDLRHYDAVSAGVFVMSPTLLQALDGLEEPSLTRGVEEAARRGLVIAHDVGNKLWQDVDSPSMKLHAEWILRVYGDDLAQPVVHADKRNTADDTLKLIERLVAEKDLPRYTLFSPGPVMTSARVKAALVHHDVCHRDEEYSAVVRRLQTKLRPIFRASPEHEMLLITGSGTAAMEMSISSTVPPGKKLLIIANGAFGERLEEIATLHQIPTVVLRYAWGELPVEADVVRALKDPDIGAAAMIYNETSVGLLNPVGAVGRLCEARGVTLIVDAVSALGAEDLDVVRDHIGICYASANKCIHSDSGVSFLCVAPQVWERIAQVPPRVYYLDMKRYRRYLQELNQTPFTPAVSAFFALEAAVDELQEQGGLGQRRETYRWRNLRIRRVLADLGFESFTNTGRESHTICTMRLPDFITVDALYSGMKEKGFGIYKCKGRLAARHVQVSNMGDLSDQTIDGFLAAMTEVVTAARAAAQPGSTERPVLKSV